MTSVTLISVSHNSLHALPTFFTGLGDLRVLHRVVVVDSGSADPLATRSLVEAAGADFLDAQANVGYGTASNLGARGVESSWVAFVNPDVTIEANALLELCEVGDRHGIDCLGPRLIDRQGNLTPSARREMSPPWRRRRQPTWSVDGVVPAGSVSGCAMVVRKAAFERIGGFDEAFFMFAEELDLQKRLADLGGLVAVVPHVRAVTAGGGSSEGVTARWAAAERSVGHVRYTRKHFGSVAGLVDLAYRYVEIGLRRRFRPRRESWQQLHRSRVMSVVRSSTGRAHGRPLPQVSRR